MYFRKSLLALSVIGCVFLSSFALAADWATLGSGMGSNVNALAVDASGNLYAGGAFTTAGGVTANRIAKWDGTSWLALGSGMNDTVSALAVDASGNLYAGGAFTTAGGVSANRIAKWDGTNWSAVGSWTQSNVWALAVDASGNVYAGGVDCLAKWNGTSWSSLRGGLQGANGVGSNIYLYALAVDASGNLYVGGDFATAGGKTANRIAKWNGTSWSTLGSGLNNNPSAFAFDASGNLHAGGGFTTAGGVAANRIAKWDGTGWSALGTGMNSAVYALAFDTLGNLYAGGYFTTADGVTADRIAKWNGTSWSALGLGMNDYMHALAIDESGYLYAGGYFTTAGGKVSPYIARCNISDGGGTSTTTSISTTTTSTPIDFTYTIAGGVVTITGYTGAGGAVVIPDTINGMPVITIASQAFYNKVSITGITIPGSVFSIGSSVFLGCTGLASIDVAASNLNYSSQDGVLYNKAATTLIQYPASKSNGAFEIPNSVTIIGDGAFYQCTTLASVMIPYGVTSIGYEVFQGCTGLTSVTLPDSVTSIGNYAFAECSGLTRVTLSARLTSIGDLAFAWCSGLTRMDIPASVTSIGEDAISGSEIYFYGNAPYVAPYALSGIVYYIGGKTGFTYGTWCPNGSPCRYCPPYPCYTTRTFVPPTIPYLDFTYTVSNGTVEIASYTGAGGAVVIPDTIAGMPVVSIGYEAFYNKASITAITMPSGITGIGESAFLGCTGLTSVTIPGTVTHIGQTAFYGCTGLTSATIMDGVKSIGNYMFYGCTGLTGIVIPSSITSIGDWAFASCRGLTSVNLPDSVETLGAYAFINCTGLTSVTSLGLVQDIKERTFSGCSSLTSIALSRYLWRIGKYAFQGCTSLTSITIPALTSYINDGAFSGCRGLTSIIIPNSVASIGAAAFEGCTGLTSATIGRNVSSIGNYAFAGCTVLTAAYFYGNAPTMGTDVFGSCASGFMVYYTYSATGFIGGQVPGYWCPTESTCYHAAIFDPSSMTSTTTTIRVTSYTKLDADGNDLPDSASTWAMVRDNVTGLIWEVKHNQDGVISYGDPNDADNTYTRQNALNAVAYLNSQSYGGRNDWRLPTIKELSSLVDRHRSIAINGAYFPDVIMNTAEFWTSSIDAGNTGLIWYIQFVYGNTESSAGTSSYHFRAVRGGPLFTSFIDNGDGTVADLGTGLMWQKATAPGTYTWPQAMYYCGALNLAGYTDWRLPDTNDLQSLVDYGRYDPAIDTSYFPDTDTADYYWSSQIFVTSFTEQVWILSFLRGELAEGWHASQSYHHTRAVRGGQGVFDYVIISKTGSGSGTVTSDDGNINCGPDCAQTYETEPEITLTAAPAEGTVFAGWSGGGCSGTGACTVTVNAHLTVTANFILSNLDTDGDGIPNAIDNCPNKYNPLQLDADVDGIGDVCDPTPGCGGCGQAACEQYADTDGDGIPDVIDNCPNVYNPQQLDANGNGTGDCCDPTPGCGGCGQVACEAVCAP